MSEQWTPIRAIADRRGVTPDAAQKQLKRGRLDLPWRRTNTGRLEVLVDLDSLPPPPPTDSAPLVAAMERRITELQQTIHRLVLERDAERAWLEHEREGRIDDAARHTDQLKEMSGQLAEAAAQYGRAQEMAERLQRDIEALRRRRLLDRLLNR